MNQVLRQKVRGLAKTYLKPMLGAPQDEPVYPRIRWVKARIGAVKGRRRLYQGHQIEWDAPMHAWSVPFDIAGPGPGEVLIRTTASAISVGTELAFFCLQPNTDNSFPRYPGYSMAGEVVAVGSRVGDLPVGALVAGAGPHASLVRLPVEAVFRVPPQVSARAAALVQLGIIAYHGIWRAEIRPGERVAVLGRGVVGQLTGQIAQTLGVDEVVSVAPSLTHVTESLRRSGCRVIATADTGLSVLDSIAADVTFDASGDPRAVVHAIRATRPGGRVILLGSSRGVTDSVDLADLADRRVMLVGAGIRTLPRSRPDGTRDYGTAGRLFLSLLADGQLNAESLIEREVNPWEAGWFYRHMADGFLHAVGAIFRWDKLHSSERARRRGFLSRPNVEAVRRQRLAHVPYNTLTVTSEV